MCTTLRGRLSAARSLFPQATSEANGGYGNASHRWGRHDISGGLSAAADESMTDAALGTMAQLSLDASRA
ncbi:MAG: hypothetical protein MUO38_04645 [Anaerolineales bacterium]|nr:hypothetical protein [Anaerolineales bacterium]